MNNTKKTRLKLLTICLLGVGGYAMIVANLWPGRENDYVKQKYKWMHSAPEVNDVRTLQGIVNGKVEYEAKGYYDILGRLNRIDEDWNGNGKCDTRITLEYYPYGNQVTKGIDLDCDGRNDHRSSHW